MTFKNEFVPPLEQETSEFLKKAREILRTGHTNYDQWTVDREREMVLFRRGGGDIARRHKMKTTGHFLRQTVNTTLIQNYCRNQQRRQK